MFSSILQEKTVLGVGLGSDLLPHGVKIGKRVLPHGAKSTPPAISVSESLHHGAKRTHPATSVSESLHHGAKEVGPHYLQASLCTMGQKRTHTAHWQAAKGRDQSLPT